MSNLGETMRNSKVGIRCKTIYFLAFSLNFTLLSSTYPLHAAPHHDEVKSHRIVLDRVEAAVNTRAILTSDISHFREIVKLRSQLDPLFAGTSLSREGAEAKSEAITEFLIDEKIIAQQFPKSDQEVEQEVLSIQNSNHLDRQALKEALAREGFSFSDYFELIRTSSSKRELIDREIRTKVSISDDELKNWFYGQYVKNTAIPKSYHLSVLSITIANYKNYAAARQVLLDSIKRVQQEESFEDVARNLNDDGTGSSGGDLGTLSEDHMSPTIRDQVKKLNIGKMGEIFESTPGHLMALRLNDVHSAEEERYEKMKEEIRNQLSTAEYQHQIALWLDRHRQSSFVHKRGGSASSPLKE